MASQRDNRGILFRQGGGREVLEAAPLPAPPDPGPRQILVRVAAAGVNPIDTKIRAQPERFPVELPAVPGCDGAGTVEAVGAEVDAFRPGDEVYFCQCGFHGRQGSYARYALVEAALAAPKPRTLSFAEAAALPLVLITAWESLHQHGRLQAGEKVLVQAGAGGVGHIAVQLAAQAGAAVCTTVRSEEKARLADTLGAQAVIRLPADDPAAVVNAFTGGRGVDLALDTVGGEVLSATFPLVAPYGRVVTLLQPAPDTRWSEARLRNLAVHLELMLSPLLMGLEEAMARQGDILRKGAALVDEGRLKVVVAEVLPLEQAAEAHRLLEEVHPAGKLVLEIP